MGLLLVLLVLASFVLFYFHPYFAEEPPVQEGLEPVSSSFSDVGEEDRYRGLHCIDERGVHPEVVDHVEQVLAKPDSFRHFGTRIYPVRHGRHFLAMRYQAIAKDANRVAGGVVKALVDHDSCSATEIERIE